MRVLGRQGRALLFMALVAVWLAGCNDGGTNPSKYSVEISGGGSGALGDGSYEAGAVVFVSAGTPPSGYTFYSWTTTSRGVSFDDAGSATTWFTMPANAVTVTANFQQNGVTPPPPPPSGDDSTLVYGGKTYKTVVIGGTRWMAENLNYATSSGSWCYDNDNSKCNTYGRLYNWDTAMTVCPNGWKLPDTTDWLRLFEEVGGSDTGDHDYWEEIVSKKLKTRNGWDWNDYDNISGNGTDDFGFSALPGGIYWPLTDANFDAGFHVIGEVGFWWTATKWTDRRNPTIYGGFGLGLHNSGNVEGKDILNSVGFSVRCIKQ
jgi:uncharacterized protein (TIGR02145 family)